MITQDFINGYIQALDNINSMLDETIRDTDILFNEKAIGPEEFMCMNSCYTSVQRYIDSVKDSYKKMIQEHNEKFNKGN